MIFDVLKTNEFNIFSKSTTDVKTTIINLIDNPKLYRNAIIALNGYYLSRDKLSAKLKEIFVAINTVNLSLELNAINIAIDAMNIALTTDNIYTKIYALTTCCIAYEICAFQVKDQIDLDLGKTNFTNIKNNTTNSITYIRNSIELAHKAMEYMNDNVEDPANVNEVNGANGVDITTAVDTAEKDFNTVNSLDLVALEAFC
jgi:hypothetical protein